MTTDENSLLRNNQNLLQLYLILIYIDARFILVPVLLLHMVYNTAASTGDTLLRMICHRMLVSLLNVMTVRVLINSHSCNCSPLI